MMFRSLCRSIVIQVVCLLIPSVALAQPALCVNEHLAKVKKDGPTLGITAAEAERLVTEVAQSIGLQRTVSVIPCGFAEKAYAWPGRPENGVPEGEYIIYNPDWVREIIGKDRVQAVALFGHELGHFLNADFSTRKDIPRKDKERDADRFAGCAVAKLSGDFAKLEDLLSRLRLEKDSLYPDRLTSIESAKAGFNSCGGSIVKLCRLPEHGLERWGFETTVTRDSNWRGGGGSQPGYCAELIAQLKAEYPKAQEFESRASSERTRDSCSPFRCIQYQYTCMATVRGDAIFKEMKSTKCP